MWGDKKKGKQERSAGMCLVKKKARCTTRRKGEMGLGGEVFTAQEVTAWAVGREVLCVGERGRGGTSVETFCMSSRDDK